MPSSSSATVRSPLSTQQYGPDVTEPHGEDQLEAFDPEPWPRWRFRLGDGLQVEQEVFARKGSPVVSIAWSLVHEGEEPPASVPLRIRPFLSGRDYHALQRENDALQVRRRSGPLRDRVAPYEGSPGIVALTNGHYRHDPTWYRNFRYAAEAERGLDETEDLAAPGWIDFDLAGCRWLPVGSDVPLYGAVEVSGADLREPVGLRELAER